MHGNTSSDPPPLSTLAPDPPFSHIDTFTETGVGFFE